MTEFAHRGSQIAAIWSVGHGLVWDLVIDVGDAHADSASWISQHLTEFSDGLWATFGRAPDDPLLVGTTIDGMTSVERARKVLRDNYPELGEDRYLVSYDPIESAALRLARAINELPAPVVADVHAEVEKEIMAVEQAALGVLSGRSQQAVSLSPMFAPPNQVAAADQLIQEGDLDLLFTNVQATAACVAAASWLNSAAHMLSELLNRATDNILELADNIQSVDIDTCGYIVDELTEGMSPDATIAELLDEGTPAQDNPDSEYGELDPARPAPDLLARILQGLRVCRLVFADGFDLDDEGLTEEESYDRCIEIYWERLLARRTAADN